MNWDNAEANWPEFKSKLTIRWGKLTKAHLDKIAGKRVELLDSLQGLYGVSLEEAEKQVQSFESYTKDIKPKPAAA